MRRIIATVLTLFISGACAALSSIDLQLSAVQYGFLNVHAQGKLSVTPIADNQWRAQMHATGKIGEQNEVAIFSFSSEQSIQPISYQSLAKVSFFSESKDYQFTDQTISGKVNDEPFSTNNYDTLDPLTRLLSLQQQLQAGQVSLTLSTISWNTAKDQSFQVSRRGLMNTNAGKLKVTLVKQTSGLKANEQSYYWFADDYEFTPIRWRQEVDGKIKYEVRLLSGSVNNIAITGI